MITAKGECSVRAKLLEDLYGDQIARLLDAELQQQSVLPRLEQGAGAIELKKALQRHIVKTREHVRRLEAVAAALHPHPFAESKAMLGILAEAADCIDSGMDTDLLDAALIGSLLAAESHEVACYTSVVSLARLLGRTEESDLLMQSLHEEKVMDDTLYALAEILTGETADAEHQLH